MYLINLHIVLQDTWSSGPSDTLFSGCTDFANVTKLPNNLKTDQSLCRAVS